jgi:hypothetical protein
VRASQEKALQALQAYTLGELREGRWVSWSDEVLLFAGHYPDSPAKFGELLLRIPELQRTCQVREIEVKLLWLVEGILEAFWSLKKFLEAF